MARFSANLSMLFTERPFLDRFGAAARAGFRGVEYMSPYEFPAAEIVARLRDFGLTQALFNLPMGDIAKGELGVACLPDRVEEFRWWDDLYVGALHITFVPAQHWSRRGILDTNQVRCPLPSPPLPPDGCDYPRAQNG